MHIIATTDTTRPRGTYEYDSYIHFTFLYKSGFYISHCALCARERCARERFVFHPLQFTGEKFGALWRVTMGSCQHALVKSYNDPKHTAMFYKRDPGCYRVKYIDRRILMSGKC